MENTEGEITQIGSAFWIPRRADGTFGEVEVPDDLSIRVYSGDELKAEARIQDVSVFSMEPGEEVFALRELEEVDEALTPRKECRSVKVGTSGIRCDKFTCRDGEYDYTCVSVGVTTPQGAGGGCLCRQMRI